MCHHVSHSWGSRVGASGGIVAATQLSESQVHVSCCMISLPSMCRHVALWSANSCHTNAVGDCSCAVAICQHHSFCYSQLFAIVCHLRDASNSVSAIKLQQEAASCSTYAVDDATDDAPANVGHGGTSNTASAYVSAYARGRRGGRWICPQHLPKQMNAGPDRSPAWTMSQALTVSSGRSRSWRQFLATGCRKAWNGFAMSHIVCQVKDFWQSFTCSHAWSPVAVSQTCDSGIG